MFGKPEGKPKGLNWLYRDTYIGKRKGITLGFSFAMQNDIDQELISDTQGPAPGINGQGKPSPGAGSVQVRVPYMILPNPITTPEVRNHPVDMRMYGADLAIHYGPLSFILEAGQHQFKNVFLDAQKLSEDFKNNWFIIKGAYALNPKSTTVFEPYVSYYIWDPDIKEDSKGRAYGDAANFIKGNKAGKEKATLGKISVTSLGVNIWYTKAKLMSLTFEYQIINEERNEITPLPFNSALSFSRHLPLIFLRFCSQSFPNSSLYLKYCPF